MWLKSRLIRPLFRFSKIPSLQLSSAPADAVELDWSELQWLSQVSSDPPTRAIVLKSALSVRNALKLLNSGIGILWEGDYHHGKTFFSLLSKRINIQNSNATIYKAGSLKDIFLHERRQQALQVTALGRFILRVGPDHSMGHLPRAPDIADALQAAHGHRRGGYCIPLREILGAVGSWEWRKKGVYIPILNDYIYPHFGVFCPTVRNDYIKLMSTVPISEKVRVAYDIGVGTGVLSALLLKRGVRRVVATDISERALTCAHDNLERLGMRGKVDLIRSDIYPFKDTSLANEKPDLIVCNPPWIPCEPSNSLIDQAIYDNNGVALKKYLEGVSANLGGESHCEAFLILSDLAERIGLRTRSDLLNLIDRSGLDIVDKIDTVPCRHPRRNSSTDKMNDARSAEVTSLWRLKVKT